VSPRSALHAQRLFALSVDLLVVLDAELRFQHVSPSWKRVLGYEPDELIGRLITELWHPDDVGRTEAAVEALESGAALPDFENRIRHADGHYVWLRWSGIVDQHDGLMYSSARDITSERKALDEAKAAIRRMEDAQAVAKVGSWEVDLRTGERHYSREMYAIQGMDPERDSPWDMDLLLERVDPAHRERILQARADMYAKPGAALVEYRQIYPREAWIRTTMEALRGPDGEPYLLRGTSQDVTELRVNERRLAEAERLADTGSFEWRVSDGAVVWSEGTYRLFGMDPSSPPLTQAEIMPLALPEEVERWAAVQRETATGRPWALEFSIPTPGGGPGRRVISVRGEAYKSADDTYVRGTMQDITQQRRAAGMQQAIARLGQQALASNDLKKLFDDVCQVGLDLLNADVAHVLALQGDGSFAYAAKLGLGETAQGTAIPAGQKTIGRQALERVGPIVVDDWQDMPADLYSPYLRSMGIRSTATVAVRSDPQPFGIIAIHSLSPGVAGAGQNPVFLDALASFLATAIERLRHEAEIAALATLRGRLVAENLEAEERVRQRISEQLHDGALQDLLAARQDLVEAAGATADDKTRGEMLGYAREGVERAVKLLREAVHALHPVVLQHGGLEAAMQAAADQAARQGSFRAQVSVDPAAAGLRDELVLSLARELLNNAAKHAQADVVQVTVARQDGHVLLEVADDGKGLDAEAVAAAPMAGHIGLASLTQRVEAVGGTLDLRSAPSGRGTTVLARLPIG
jgi:PAS domain S-box-containing protein